MGANDKEYMKMLWQRSKCKAAPGVMVKTVGFGKTCAWEQILPLPLPSSVTLVRLLNLPVLQFPYV